MAYCGDCIHLDVCKSADACDGRVPKCKHFKSKRIATRADQFRVMSDEQLAAALYFNADCVWCRNEQKCGKRLDAGEHIETGECIACVLKWLQEGVTHKVMDQFEECPKNLTLSPEEKEIYTLGKWGNDPSPQK